MHILGAQHASDPANPKSMGFISLLMGAQTLVPHGTHINLTACLMLVLGCRVKGVSEMHILGAQERVGRYQSGRVTNGRRFGKA